MDPVLSFNDVSQSIDFASVDATDEKPVIAVMAFTPSKGWTFFASQKSEDVQSVCKAFPVLALTQGIEIAEPPMTIERAKKIVSDMFSVFMCTQGINGQYECKNINDYSLQEMLDANEMLNGYSEKTEKGKNTFMHFHPRGTAALYAWAHHTACSDNGIDPIEPIVHAQGKALVLINAEMKEAEDECEN